MRQHLAFLFWLFSVAAATSSVAIIDVRGTPPPPYTDPSVSITNALGGVGRTQGWTAIAQLTAVDLLADSVIPAAIKTDVEAVEATYNTRFVTVTRILDDASEANLGVCVRLGPNTDTPALACADTDEIGQAGGCYLIATGDRCTFTIRPIQQCTSYATCHQPLWAMASGGTAETTKVQVSVVW